MMADRDKGGDAAARKEFINSLKKACTRHLATNMKDAKVYHEHNVWKAVARALTREERDIKWQELLQVAPRQAEWLGRLEPNLWQTCEIVAHGFRSFGATTNNVGESTGFALLKTSPGTLCIRERSPPDCIHGLLDFLVKQSTRLRRSVTEGAGFMFIEPAIRLHVQERTQAPYYTVVQNGIGKWRVERNDKYRLVTFQAASEFGMLCECNLSFDRRVKCRHILAVELAEPDLCTTAPISSFYAMDRYAAAFQNYSLSMPSQNEMQEIGPGNFPSFIKPPIVKKGRGRPKKLRHRKWFESLRRAQRMVCNDAGDPNARACTICRVFGHNKRNCPDKELFKVESQS